METRVYVICEKSFKNQQLSHNLWDNYPKVLELPRAFRVWYDLEMALCELDLAKGRYPI